MVFLFIRANKYFTSSLKMRMQQISPWRSTMQIHIRFEKLQKLPFYNCNVTKNNSSNNDESLQAIKLATHIAFVKYPESIAFANPIQQRAHDEGLTRVPKVVCNTNVRCFYTMLNIFDHAWKERITSIHLFAHHFFDTLCK